MVPTGFFDVVPTGGPRVWLLQCAKMREMFRAGNFLPFLRPITKLTTGLCGVSIYSASTALRPVALGYMSG